MKWRWWVTSAGARTLTEVNVITISKKYVAAKFEQTDPVVALFMKAILGRFRKMHTGLKVAADGASVEEAIHKGGEVELEDYGRESAFTAGHLALIHELENGLHTNQFQLHYQAVVNLQSAGIEGFEALLRQIHPSRGIIPPNDFISIAEDSGLIVPIGYMALTHACELMTRIDNAQINVNLSARQFEEEDLIDKLRKILQLQCPDPGRLCFEITESVLMSNPDRVEEMLTQIKSIGIRIAIDDFGTGYSSFSYLSRFPIDVLKIDRSFVASMLDNPKSLEIVRALISLAQSMRMDAVAEGVETEHQAERLRDMGCDYAQGYYYSRPVPMPDAIGLFSRTS